MGNHSSCVVPNTKGSIHLIHSDGGVEILHKTTTAGEVIQSFPEHLVCHSDSFYIGQKVPALSPEEDLKMGNTYFVLPKKSFRSVLSLVSIASLISPCKASAVNPYSMARTPLVNSNAFEIQKGVGGGIRIKVSAEFISKLIEEGRFSSHENENKNNPQELRHGKLCSTPQLQKDYGQLVVSRTKLWKPKLETIVENENVRRFKIRRRHKSS